MASSSPARQTAHWPSFMSARPAPTRPQNAWRPLGSLPPAPTTPPEPRASSFLVHIPAHSLLSVLPPSALRSSSRRQGPSPAMPLWTLHPAGPGKSVPCEPHCETMPCSERLIIRHRLRDKIIQSGTRSRSPCFDLPHGKAAGSRLTQGRVPTALELWTRCSRLRLPGLTL